MAFELHAKITHVGMEIDVASGKVLNTLLLEMPDATTVQVIAAEDVTKRVISLMAQGLQGVEASPAPRMRPTKQALVPVEPPPEDPEEDWSATGADQRYVEDGSVVFGGRPGPPSFEGSSQVPPAPPEPVPPPQVERPRMDAQVVDVDGYPTLRGPGRIDVGQVLGHNPEPGIDDGRDDDGVGSI